ncbi:MAG TPA: phenylalanine--tRNA ligase subunit alpha [Gaiellaceae bacterium]|nr:phenylalanine--tRNA ligase subunit alpha [Gaiellaceae bacterium]
MDWEAYERQFEDALKRVKSLDDVDQLRIDYLGRKGELAQALRNVRDRETGMQLNALRARLQAAIDSNAARMKDEALQTELREEQLDVTLPGEHIARGVYHLLTQIRREVEDVFLGLGYQVVDGDEVEDAWHLFDALNMGPAHVTRSPLHTLYLNGDVVLRTETSPSQIRAMEEKQPPVYMVSLGRVYRRDTVDATHFPIFHQVEGLAVDRGITLADLKGTLLHLARALFGEDREVRFATDFFPFTEPSMQASVSCFLCGGTGCRVCKESGWIEMGGSGVVDPNVLVNVGYDPEEVSGFAFGLGLERIAMLRHGVPDLRMFWENDLRFLRQF